MNKENRVEDLIAYAKGYVHSDLAKMLLADLLNINSLELLTILDKELDDNTINEYKRRVEELSIGKPIQYIIGNVNFYGNKFICNSNTLIPRFETECLVEKTLEKINILFKDKLNNNQKLDIIDLGTGTGCIGLTLKKKLNSNVTLLDISKDALEVAKLNAKELNLEVKFIENNMLDNINDKYDVIISNPPYIKDNEEIEEIVKNNEPHLALYGGIDGLKYYRNILSNIKNNIKENYLIAFEIGDSQKEDLFSLAKEYLDNYNIECIKDYSNRDRIILIYNKDEII